METERPGKVRHGLTRHPSPPSSLAPVSQVAPGNLDTGQMLTQQGWVGGAGRGTSSCISNKFPGGHLAAGSRATPPTPSRKTGHRSPEVLNSLTQATHS